MWQAIAQQISQSTDSPFSIVERRLIQGSHDDGCYVVTDTASYFFVKVCVREQVDRYIAESDGLNALRQTETVNTPDVITVGTVKEHTFIVLEFFHCQPLEQAKASYLFGQQLAMLHSWGEQKEFGFDHDNHIGITVQPNAWQKKWSSFFAEQRIGWQLQILREKGIELVDIDDFVKFIEAQLSSHHPRPSLLHGDLWHGNVAQCEGRPVCYDPACYWGDAECDLAMTELFGGFEPEFYQGYESVSPIKLGYEIRKHIYNLYHILNHCNCFGGHYLDDAQALLERIGYSSR